MSISTPGGPERRPTVVSTGKKPAGGRPAAGKAGSGKPAELLNAVGIDAEHIVRAARSLVTAPDSVRVSP